MRKYCDAEYFDAGILTDLHVFSTSEYFLTSANFALDYTVQVRRCYERTEYSISRK
jgi:hypothetical protein